MSETDRLRDFLRAARGCSQEQIIIEFLETAVAGHPNPEQGSVLIKHPDRDALIHFNANDFLFEKKLLDPNAMASWPSELRLRGTIAGLCYRTKSTKTFRREDGASGSDFFGSSPIQNMVCIPIQTGGEWPFGIVCFHNNDPQKNFPKPKWKRLNRASTCSRLRCTTLCPNSISRRTCLGHLDLFRFRVPR